MMRRVPAAKVRGRLEGAFVFACLLGLTLLLGHQLVMASARHAAEMGMGRGQSTPSASTMPNVVGPTGDLTPAERQPPIGWEACLSQEGLLPALLLLLLALVSVWWRLAGARLADLFPRAGTYPARFLHPPPLEPSRRRALLQVFLN